MMQRHWLFGVLALAFCAQRYFIHERVAVQQKRRDGKPLPRKILITGGASGIGKATAILFHSKGWSVGVADLDLEAAQALVQELGSERARAFKLDVTNPNSCAQVAETFCDDALGMDALFNSAGLLAIGMFKDLDLSRQTKQIRVNLEGLVNMTYAALPKLKLCEQSVIVSMASGSAQSGTPTHAVYGATKAAVYSLTEALAIELNGEGVRVADVSVGRVATPMLANQENRNSLLWSSPYVTPELVAETVFAAVHKARLHREHFYVEYSTALIFKLQALFRALGVRLGMQLVSFICMPY